MTSSTTAERLVAALAGAELSLAKLIDAVQGFTAGERPAAVTTAEWLRSCALDEYGSARAYVWIAQGRVHGYFAITVGVARLEPRVLVELQAGPRALPAVLLAQAARWPAGELLAPGAVLEGALGVAERIRQYAGVGALVLDPADPQTSAMWQRRGFQPVLDPPPRGHERRLWRALGGEDDQR
jgi:hypothetical protein